MNILLIVRFFATGVGGAAFVFNLISQMLADDGHNVFVLTNSYDNIDGSLLSLYVTTWETPCFG